MDIVDFIARLLDDGIDNCHDRTEDRSCSKECKECHLNGIVKEFFKVYEEVVEAEDTSTMEGNDGL